jgi:hypothetical protein
MDGSCFYLFTMEEILRWDELGWVLSNIIFNQVHPKIPNAKISHKNGEGKVS